MSRWKQKVSDVYYPEHPEEPVFLSSVDINRLRFAGQASETGKARYCAHSAEQSSVHEMFIYHSAETVIAPHKASHGPESYFLLEGCLELIFYSDAGKPQEVVRLGAYLSDLEFFYRMPTPRFRGIVIIEDALFLETKEGPFTPDRVIWATWNENDSLLERVLKDSSSGGGLE